MKKVKVSDMTTVEISIDEVGKIFFYENRILRAINDSHLDHVKELFISGFIKEIVDKGLFPNTWESNIKIEGYSLIIEHEYIFHWNYPYEWSFNMLKDAGLVILQINEIANKYNYEIMDAHASNIVFNMNKAQYIDFGSFVKLDKSNNITWKSYNIYYNHFYIPLYLWSKGYPDIARNIYLMRDYFNEIEFLKIKFPIINLISNKYIFNLMQKLKALALIPENIIRIKITNKNKQNIILLLKKLFQNKFTTKKLKNEILSFKKPIESSMWNNYHTNKNPSKNKRFVRIAEIIDSFYDANSLVELASNQGKFAEYVLSKTHIKTIIATDYDREAVDIMYLNNKSNNNFLPLLFDFIRTNTRKYDEYIFNRIKCDIVLALAVTHHLILTQKIPIDYIFNIMKKLTNKYIIIEFMPLGLYNGNSDNTPILPQFYNIDWFKENFINHFDLISYEKLEINRYIFVGVVKDIQYEP